MQKGYIAKTGDAAKERLALQHRVFAPGTELLLRIAKFKPSMKVLIVGCGCGDETIMIAQKMVGHGGEIVAMDKSSNQIEQTRLAIIKSGVPTRITYLTKSVDELDPADGEYDLIVCRLVISYFFNPKIAIQLLKNRLRPGGVLASQETIVSSCYSIPHSPALKRYLDLMQAFAVYHKLNFDMAQNIPMLFSECGLQTISETWQPEVHGDDKRMVELSAIECMPAIQEANLIRPIEAEHLIKALNDEITIPPTTVLFQCVNVLTVGTN
jgi:ubiquinone/menaquinone biosynthesis C-methylase UbiE